MSGVLAAAAADGLRRVAILCRRRASLFSTTTASSSSFSTSSDNDNKPPSTTTTVTLEVRAGTGGLDASLFAAELFRAYSRHAARVGWDWSELRRLSSAAGAAAARIRGRGVAESLRNEAGVHRVQRVPVTESGGRQQTSAATIAILEENDAFPSSPSSSSSSPLLLNPEEVRIDTMRSSGKGGQHANTTDSAVRAVHLRSGIAVAVRSCRSQHRNKAAAVAELSKRVREKEESGKMAKVSSERRGQVGGGDRSEKIRTYNFARGVVSDHRSGVKIGDVAAVMRGERLGELFLIDDEEKKS